MKLGLIVRAVKTGLGHQTWEIWRHLNPTVTVVVDHGDPLQPWYGPAPSIPWQSKGELPGAFDLLKRCDLVVSAETFYDWSLPDRLSNRGVPTVLIANPELYDGHRTTHVWNPTSWMMRDDWRHVPHPCPVDRYPEVVPLLDPLRVLHPTSVAMLDRNGSQIARRVQRFGKWRQDTFGPLSQNRPENYWDRDPGYAASLIPRRYGGLCLPALEAFSAGTPVLMPDVPPNSDWPIIPIPHHMNGQVRMKGGSFPILDFRTESVSKTVKEFLDDREKVEAQRVIVRAWAEANSWEALLPLWQAELERAANFGG